MSEITALLRIVDELDGEGCDCDHGAGYITCTRWANGMGETDEEAQALFRRLIREELGSYPVGEVGAAVLAAIDSRAREPEAVSPHKEREQSVG